MRLLFALFFALLWRPLEAESPQKYRLVICALFQDEAFFLREWIEFHRLIGVEHFYLYDNLSTDDYAQILKPYLEEGLVELLEWPVETRNQWEYWHLLQLPVYNDALARAKESAQWAAFIDLDEFLVPLRHDHLEPLLAEYEEYGGLAVNWQLFGTSGLDVLSEGKLLIESLLWKASPDRDAHRIVKLVVQPQRVAYIGNPHSFEFCGGFCAVASDGSPQPSGQMGGHIVLDTIQLNHYWCGTKEWFLKNKLPRRTKWGTAILPEHLELILSSFNEVKDEAILKFVPQLKERMARMPKCRSVENTGEAILGRRPSIEGAGSMM